MPRDKLPNKDHDLLGKLFGDPAEMDDEDLAMLFEALAPAAEAKAIVHRIAESAAVAHRLKNRLPPDHIQAALEATKEVKSLDNATATKLQQIIEALKGPFRGAVVDPVFAYRYREGELDKDDQAIIDKLTDELRSGWNDEDKGVE